MKSESSYCQSQPAGRIFDRHVDVVAIRDTRRGDRERRAGVRQVVERGADDDVAAFAATGDRNQAVGRILCDAGNAEAYAQVAAEVVVDDDDARFDQHLPNRNVQGTHEAADILQAFCRVLHEQRIGAVVDADTAAIRQQAVPRAGAGFATDQGRKVTGLRVIHLQEFRIKRFQLGDRLPGLKIGRFAGRNFFSRRDDDDVAVLAHVEALGRHDDVERLVPRYVTQSQRNVALDRVRHDDIAARCFG